MVQTGSGTGTPISGGPASGLSLAQPYPRTLLSLPHYAKIMGINPLHFAGAQTPGLNPQVFPVTNCSKIWEKYDWQNYDAVSKHQIAELIYEAESEVASVLGFWPAPYWTENELHQYPQPFNRELIGNGRNVRGEHKSIISTYGKVISPGIRSVDLQGTATTAGSTLVYSDEDGDGFYETATVIMTTSVTNVNELKVFNVDMGGALEWEIRPCRSKAISGGRVEFIFDSWLFIDPTLYELPPNTDEVEAIDVSTTSNFVASVDVYREYIDPTADSATFFWTSDRMNVNNIACPNCGIIGCTTCEYGTQGGCILPRDHHTGDLVVYPASYDTDSASWASECWAYCVEPDITRVNYISGDQSQEYLQGRSFEPLSDAWAQAIAWIATARLERPVCDCGGLQTLAEQLARDITHSTGGDAHFVTQDVMNSPFGTRMGEVMAWRKIKKASPEKRLSFALV